MSQIYKREESWYTENNTRYVFLDGTVCADLSACYRSLQEQLSLPDYFGHNLDALEEVLEDLEWINETCIKIILLNPTGLLAAEVHKKAAFLAVLNNSSNDKLQVYYTGIA